MELIIGKVEDTDEIRLYLEKGGDGPVRLMSVKNGRVQVECVVYNDGTKLLLPSYNLDSI